MNLLHQDLIFLSKKLFFLNYRNSNLQKRFWYDKGACHISSVIRQSFFPFQNNPKNLDPSYKMDLGLWDCLGKVQFVLKQNFIRLI